MSADNPGIFDTDSPTDSVITRSFDWKLSDEPTLTVVETVADSVGKKPETLEPLSSLFDTDSLNYLFNGDRSQPDDGHVQFSFESCYVRVTADGRVLVARE